LIRHHWIRRRVVVPILELLRQGVTPEKLALSLAIGMVLGVSPILGVTTLLALVVCYATGLNPIAMQLTNYLMYPAQIILLIPFIRAGETLFREQHRRITAEQIQQLVHSNATFALRLLWTAIWHAVVIWVLIAPAAIVVLYGILTPILRHAAKRLHPRSVRATSS
jgi:uncharacterized protein (DUF2062 family)